MNKKLSSVLLFLTLLVTFSCNNLKKGVGLRGVFLEDDLMTLDGDTFNVGEKIGDSLLVIWDYPDKYEPNYLIRKKRNGFYYFQQKARSISSIDNTLRFVSMNGNEVYDTEKDSSFTILCDGSSCYLLYLGQLDGQPVFTNQDTICFSDGRCVALQNDAYCKAAATDGYVCFVMGARRLDVSLNTLHRFMRQYEETDSSIEKFSKSYYIQSRNEYGNMKAGFYVDLDIPKGDLEADRAVREWMLKSIKDDAFSLLGYEQDIPLGKSATAEDIIATLDGYGTLWEKLCRNDYQVEDTLNLSLFGDMTVRKIADCDDYTTYRYNASLYEGGLHEMPRSYYITYDKRRHVFVNASNTIKPSMVKLFRKEVLKNMQRQYSDNFGDESVWNDYLRLVFSFHCPIVDLESMDDVMSSFLVHQYSCDEWSGWDSASMKPFTMDDFPLPHLAILPEGIVVTYHPYQIECFASGEFHPVVPFDSVSQCLSCEYHSQPKMLPKLEQFLKLKRR